MLLGVILLIIAIVIVIPVGFLMTTGLVAAVIGFVLKDNAEKVHAKSELVDLNT